MAGPEGPVLTWMKGLRLDIVIVDDQPSTRTMLRHIVQDIGPQLSVHDFGEPDAALTWCNDNRPDLLLLDYRCRGCGSVPSIG